MNWDVLKKVGHYGYGSTYLNFLNESACNKAGHEHWKCLLCGKHFSCILEIQGKNAAIQKLSVAARNLPMIKRIYPAKSNFSPILICFLQILVNFWVWDLGLRG